VASYFSIPIKYEMFCLPRRFLVNIYEMGRILSGACNLMLTVTGTAWPHYRASLCILMCNFMQFGPIFFFFSLLFLLLVSSDSIFYFEESFIGYF
jgi:hypothetical protein